MLLCHPLKFTPEFDQRHFLQFNTQRVYRRGDSQSLAYIQSYWYFRPYSLLLPLSPSLWFTTIPPPFPVWISKCTYVQCVTVEPQLQIKSCRKFPGHFSNDDILPCLAFYESYLSTGSPVSIPPHQHNPAMCVFTWNRRKMFHLPCGYRIWLKPHVYALWFSRRFQPVLCQNKYSLYNSSKYTAVWIL